MHKKAFLPIKGFVVVFTTMVLTSESVAQPGLGAAAQRINKSVQKSPTLPRPKAPKLPPSTGESATLRLKNSKAAVMGVRGKVAAGDPAPTPTPPNPASAAAAAATNAAQIPAAPVPQPPPVVAPPAPPPVSIPQPPPVSLPQPPANPFGQ